MSDLIRREDALNGLKYEMKYGAEIDRCGLDTAYDIIESVPSAEPERKKEKWQRRKGSDCWECSECHAVLESDDIVRHNFYYCYHCGANMMNKDGYMKLEGTEHE